MDEIRVVDGGLSLELSGQIAELEKAFKDLEKKEKELKAQLKEILEQNEISKIDNDVLTISVVPATTTESLDSKALKEELPDIYNTYCQIKPRAGYVKITVKG